MSLAGIGSKAFRPLLELAGQDPPRLESHVGFRADREHEPQRVEVKGTRVGGERSGKLGCGAARKTTAVGALEAKPGDGQGYAQEPIDLSAHSGDACLRLPTLHLVFSPAARWRSSTHHGALRPEHLQRYLDDVVLRFNRRKAEAISQGVARLTQHALETPPTTYRQRS